LEPEQIEPMRRHGEVDSCGCVGCGAHRAGMTDGAVEEHAVDSHVPAFAHADGKIPAFFVDEPERRVTRAIEMARTDPRHRLPDPVRKPRHALAPGGAVLEVLL